MRVLQVTDDLPATPRGGLDLHVAELNAGLRARDVESIVLKLAVGEAARVAALDAAPPQDRSARDAIDGARERPVTVAFGAPHDGRGGLAETILNGPLILAFEEALDALTPDAVHIHSMQHLSHRLVEVARRRGLQVVWTMHDFFALCQRSHLHKGDLSPCDGPRAGAACGPCFGGLRGLFAAPVFGLRNAGFANAMRTAHALIAPSRFLADVIIANGAPADRVHVIAPAVPHAPRMADLPPDPDRARFVFAGDLREAKGADLVIEAMHRLQREVTSLDIHGGAPAPPAPPESAYEQRLQERARGTHTTFHGRYSDGDLLSLLDGASALIVPSRVRETFGRTANRALQAGIPVIAADHGAVPEQVREGVNGALFVPGDVASLAAAMARVMDDGLAMQSAIDAWPTPPELSTAIEALLPLYRWAP